MEDATIQSNECRACQKLIRDLLRSLHLSIPLRVGEFFHCPAAPSYDDQPFQESPGGGTGKWCSKYVRHVQQAEMCDMWQEGP